MQDDLKTDSLFVYGDDHIIVIEDIDLRSPFRYSVVVNPLSAACIFGQTVVKKGVEDVHPSGDVRVRLFELMLQIPWRRQTKCERRSTNRTYLE